MTYPDDPDYITVKHACRIVGGQEKADQRRYLLSWGKGRSLTSARASNAGHLPHSPQHADCNGQRRQRARLMDALVCARPGCGNPLLPGRKLENFCTYACQGQFRALQATSGPSGLIGAKNSKQNKALQSLRRQSVGRFSFTRINPSTYQLDRPGKLGAGCLMEVGWPGGARQQWIARVGNRASEPLALAEAKRAAVAMLRERKKTEPRDLISEINQIAANEVDCDALMKDRKRTPRDLVGGSRRGSMQIDRLLRDEILDTEVPRFVVGHLSGDDYPLEFYDDGYPKLPECLRRKQPS